MSARRHSFNVQGTVSLLGIVLTTGSLSYESDVGRHVFDLHEEKKNHRNRLIRTAYGSFWTEMYKPKLTRHTNTGMISTLVNNYSTHVKY